MTKALLTLGIALGIAGAPVAQAQSVVADFKTQLAAKLLNKQGNAAAKAAWKTVGKYVTSNKGDPKKIIKFTKLGLNSIKKLLATSQFGKSLQFWNKFVPIKYFKQGIREYNPSDRKFQKALSLVVKKMPRSQKTSPVINRAFKELLKLNNKLGQGNADTLYVLAEAIYGDANLPNPVPPPVS